MRLIDAEKLIITEIHIKLHDDEPYKKYFQYYDPEKIDKAPTVKAIPINWIKNYASHKASKDLIDCYWHFWEDDVLKMVSDWEKENAEVSD